MTEEVSSTALLVLPLIILLLPLRRRLSHQLLESHIIAFFVRMPLCLYAQQRDGKWASNPSVFMRSDMTGGACSP